MSIEIMTTRPRVRVLRNALEYRRPTRLRVLVNDVVVHDTAAVYPATWQCLFIVFVVELALAINGFRFSFDGSSDA